MIIHRCHGEVPKDFPCTPKEEQPQLITASRTQAAQNEDEAEQHEMRTTSDSGAHQPFIFKTTLEQLKVIGNFEKAHIVVA